jgi:hypothetical protein
VKVVNPVAVPTGGSPVSLPPRPGSLSGQVLGVVINGKEYSDVILRRIVQRLQDKYEFKDVVWWDKKFPTKAAPFLEEVAAKSTIVLNGVGHCGSSTSWSVHDTVELERRGRPTVTVLSQEFADTGHEIAARQGLRNLAVAVLPHPVGAATRELVERKADGILESVVEGFTVPIQVAEDTHDTHPTRDGLIEAPDAPDEANDFFSASGWTDGLPVVPPVPRLVEAMVAASGRDGEEVIAILPPLMGAATIRAIAANAVLSGCRPEYLPVVLAAVEAVADPIYGLSHRQVTTHAGAPLIIVNGPITERLKLNTAAGVFGPGWRANATIGRALRLVLMNLGGARPGITDMSQTGHPGKYTYCIAENEAATPWEPLHVERGFEPGESTVTLVNAEAPQSITDNINTSARAILTTCASNLSSLGSNNLYSQGEPILALGIEHAKYIAAEGWSKSDVKLYIYEKARQPWRIVRGRGKSLGPNFPKWLESPEDDDTVPILAHPDELIVIVCGGAGGKSMGIPTAGRQSRSVTRLVRWAPQIGVGAPPRV